MMSGSSKELLKTDLILNDNQLKLEEYPTPTAHIHAKKEIFRKRYPLCSWTRSKYAPVTRYSPMYAMDCEMVESYYGDSEVASICIVNENLEVIYDTYIKPDVPIKDYRTQFSGITANTLKNVTTTLKDVQEFLKIHLPDNAILVGQSLNFDLLALKLMYPYIIDTSVVYNTTGDIYKKSKLKDLAKVYLHETIQSGGSHSAKEDAVASMKLIKLRLEKGQLPGMKRYNSVVKPKKRNNYYSMDFFDNSNDYYDHYDYE